MAVLRGWRTVVVLKACQMLPRWHLAGQPAGFLNTRARRDAQKRFRFRQEQGWVLSARLEMGGKVGLQLLLHRQQRRMKGLAL